MATSPDRVSRCLLGLPDLVVTSVAAGTIAFHIAYVFRLPRIVLALLWLVIAIGAIAAVAKLPDTSDHLAAPNPRRAGPALLIVAASAGVGLVAGLGHLTGRQWWLYWTVVVVGTASAAVWVIRGRSDGEHRDVERTVSRRSRVEAWGMLALATLLAAGSFATVRSDADDVFLVRSSLHTEHDSGPPAVRDTIFADERFPSTRPSTPATAIEALIGVVAWALPIGAQSTTYLLIAPLMASLSVLALWRLLRVLRVPKAAVATGLGVAFLVLDGAQPNSLGNFAFARSWQGKVIFVSVVVPLLWAHALRWARDGDRRSWAVGVACCVAGTGLTTSATFVAPAVVFLASAVGAFGNPRRLLAGLAGAAYPIVGGLLGLVAYHPAASAAIDGDPLLDIEPWTPWQTVYGDGAVLAVVTIGLLAAWVVVRDRRSRLALLLPTTLVFVAVFNPVTTHLLVTQTGAGQILWRMAWVIPVAAMVGAAFTLPWALAQVPRRLGIVAVIAVLGALAVVGTPVPTSANGVTWSATWDIDPATRAAGERMAEMASPGETVAAPEEIGRAVVLVSHDTRAINPRKAATLGLRSDPRVFSDERILLSEWLDTGMVEATTPDFIAALDLLEVHTACARRALDGSPVSNALAAGGFDRVAVDGVCSYWRRSGR